MNLEPVPRASALFPNTRAAINRPAERRPLDADRRDFAADRAVGGDRALHVESERRVWPEAASMRNSKASPFQLMCLIGTR